MLLMSFIDFDDFSILVRTYFFSPKNVETIGIDHLDLTGVVSSQEWGCDHPTHRWPERPTKRASPASDAKQTYETY